MAFMALGFFFSWVPVLGFVFAFGAPVVALAAVVFGGVALSQARKEEQESAAGLAGVILGVVTFVPALVVAMTCGACNACMTAGVLAPGGQGVKWQINPGQVTQPAAKKPAKKAGMTGAPDKTAAPEAPAEPAKPPEPGSPPPAFPPPPFAPGGGEGKTGAAPGAAKPAAPAQPAPSGK
jgi:hypothetical protein